MSRTMQEIAARYNKLREQILESIREGLVSASMSNIEYYPKPWDELDMGNYGDMQVISTALTWDPEKRIHTHTSLRPWTPEELELRDRKNTLMYKPYAERKEEMAEINRKLEALRPPEV